MASLFGGHCDQGGRNDLYDHSCFFHADHSIRTFLDASNFTQQEVPFDYMMWKDVANSNVWPHLRDATRNHTFLYWQTDAF